MDSRENAYRAGWEAYLLSVSPLDNPHAPAPPGDPLLAALWRQGWQAAKRASR